MAVSKGNGDISQEACISGTQDRALFETAAEFFPGQGQKLRQSRSEMVGAGSKVRFISWDRKSIPGTHLLAVVAPEDAVPDKGTKLAGDGAPQLNGQVRNALSGIDYKRSDYGASGTNVQTSRAGPAEGLLGPVPLR